jgi:hypothetical protein
MGPSLRVALLLLAQLSFIPVGVVCFGTVLEQPSTAHILQVSDTMPTQQKLLFEDRFDRDELTPNYDVLQLDPNRLAVGDGKLLIVATEPWKNLVLLQKTFSGDFVATVTMNMRITKNNFGGLYYWVDERNYLAVGVEGAGKWDPRYETNGWSGPTGS